MLFDKLKEKDVHLDDFSQSSCSVNWKVYIMKKTDFS